MPELSIIVPTLNERGNIELLTSLKAVLGAFDYEVVFVDDMFDDGTADLTRTLAGKDKRVRVIHRVLRRRLTAATEEAAMATTARAIAVPDGDMLYDESALRVLNDGDLELVVEPRHPSGAGPAKFPDNSVHLSGETALPDLNEPAPSLSMRGCRVLLDRVASSPRPVKFAAAGYSSRRRKARQSKFGSIAVVEYIELILDKVTFGLFPVSYLTFAVIGLLGSLIRLVIVVALLSTGMRSGSAQAASSLAVTSLSFFLNNSFTFRFTRLKGRFALWMGASGFFAVCGIGLWLNLQSAELLQAHGSAWYIASATGIGIGSIWNYRVSAAFVWRINRKANRGRAHLQAQARWHG